MLERGFKDHAAAERLRESVLGPQLDTFVAVVSDLGYSPSTIRTQLQLLANLVRWIQENEVVISSIDENITDRCLTESGRKGALQRGDKNTLRRFLGHLRTEGILPSPAPTFDDSHLTSLKRRYDDYLRKERGLSAATASRYWPFLQRFLLERFGDGPMRLWELEPQDIASFLLRHAHDRTPKVAQLMVTALRSFFRFLFRYEETKCDLSAVVPTVASWRLAEVPKHLKPDELESLLEACNRTGRTCSGISRMEKGRPWSSKHSAGSRKATHSNSFNLRASLSRMF